MTTAALLLFVLTGGVLSLVDLGAVSRVLTIPSRWTAPVALSARSPRESRRLPLPRPLPTPTAAGEILLGEGLYEAESVSFVGDLTIRGAANEKTIVVIEDHPFQIACRNLVLNRVTVRRNANGAELQPTNCLLTVRSQGLTIEDCIFTGGQLSGESRCAAVRWSAVADHDSDAGRLQFRTVSFFNGGAGFVCGSQPRQIEMNNCLKIGATLIETESWPAKDVSVQVKHGTLRAAQSLWLSQRFDGARAPGRVRFQLQNCAFDLTGSQPVLVAVCGAAQRGLGEALQIEGADSVLHAGVPVFGWQESNPPQVVPIQVSPVDVGGLTVGNFRFTGPSDGGRIHSAIDPHSLQIPRSTNTPPGIRVEPQPARDP